LSATLQGWTTLSDDLEWRSVKPTLDTASAGGTGLQVYTDANLIEHIGVANAHPVGIEVVGNDNSFYDVWVWSGSQGLVLTATGTSSSRPTSA